MSLFLVRSSVVHGLQFHQSLITLSSVLENRAEEKQRNQKFIVFKKSSNFQSHHTKTPSTKLFFFLFIFLIFIFLNFFSPLVCVDICPSFEYRLKTTSCSTLRTDGLHVYINPSVSTFCVFIECVFNHLQNNPSFFCFAKKRKIVYTDFFLFFRYKQTLSAFFAFLQPSPLSEPRYIHTFA